MSFPFLDALENLLMASASWVNPVLDPAHCLGHQGGYDEVHHRGEDQREEGFVGTASYQIAYLGKVKDGDVTDDRSFLDQGDDLVPVDGQEVLGCLGQEDAEEALMV